MLRPTAASAPCVSIPAAPHQLRRGASHVRPPAAGSPLGVRPTVNLDKKGSKLLFQIFTEREECKATAVATNSPFAEWDKTFGDPRLCAAIADRITFRCTLIQTGTESYRFRITEAERGNR
ncbi:ATP-binding protein [Streptomyces sp. NPDC020858]|uniref:ATP-binding protein n=1 Tax=Streptomyces sp. NPDC020858 TaxID=3365097 RepID=UPI0037952219